MRCHRPDIMENGHSERKETTAHTSVSSLFYLSCGSVVAMLIVYVVETALQIFNRDTRHTL
jgi:hypothetical protein